MAQYKGTMREAGRALHLLKKREKQKEQMQVLKQRIAEETLSKSKVDRKFSAHYDAVEAELRSSTVGLVTLDDMKARQEALVRERERQLAQRERREQRRRQLEAQRKRERRRAQRRQIRSLSFSPDDDDDDGHPAGGAADGDPGAEPAARARARRPLGKDPAVDTSFLPDREREEEERRLREELRREWEARRERVKREEVEVTFSYWDGCGHRRAARIPKGSTVQQFLRRALQALRPDFRELRAASAEQLMFVKEDLILPHYHTFYDLIVAQARGKSGPLFAFDVHDDVRLRSDAALEKDESHAGKVVLRSWYEKNKHIFPASRWEPYDPEKRWDRYTVR
ncbi:protein FAM50B [Hippopotamus amphibius kiboko]|uniref:protein FAM50B n=1 Tax=Hippopotamus amphibius kiboko TaxID=575201 RepID=UPI0025938A4F|nr:protein FAM50B [Hippopotamus amphibius kiboko]